MNKELLNGDIRMNASQFLVACTQAAKHFSEEYEYSVGKRSSQLACLVDDLYDLAEEVIEGMKVGKEYSDTEVAELTKLAYAKCYEWCGPVEVQILQDMFNAVLDTKPAGY